MNHITENYKYRIIELFTELLGLTVHVAESEKARPYDLVAEIGSWRFLIEWKSRGDVPSVASALRTMQAYRRTMADTEQGQPSTLPLLVVPFMGATGKALCAEANVSWLDLAGNADISTEGLRLLVQGRKGFFVPTRTRFNPFAPKASRIPRALLLDPNKRWTQAEIVQKADMDKSLVSNVVRQLERDGLLDRLATTAQPTYRVPNPGLLLDAWHEVYDFNRHEIHRGIVAARSGRELLQRIVDGCRRINRRCAATGLAGAGQLAHFADYRTVTIYVDELPTPPQLVDLGFHEDARGSNLWLTVPNDVGVFSGLQEIDEIPCVSAVQCYLDLAMQPERASDAARELRMQHLTWDKNREG